MSIVSVQFVFKEQFQKYWQKFRELTGLAQIDSHIKNRWKFIVFEVVWADAIAIS